MINPIYIRVMNGLANRLRTIQSFYHFSLIKNRPLKICWAIGQGFSEDKFDDLFENKLDFISVEQYNKVSESCVNLEKLFTITPQQYGFLMSLSLLKSHSLGLL